MDILIRWGIVFGLIFIFNLIFVVLNKKKRQKIFTTAGAVIIKKRYKVIFKDCSEKKFALVESLTNSFIFATTYVIITFFKNIYSSFLVSIPILIILIFLCYSLIGIYYKKKEGSKNV